MPDGGQVTVGTAIVRGEERIRRHNLAPGTYVDLCVVDKGVGMPPEVLQRATEPFFTTKGPGTGLGLAMVHGFVQQSHGRLEIDSKPGEGTTVRMIFPVADHGQDGAGGTGPEQDAAPPDADDLAGSRPSVLVVEDNDDVRELAESVLGMAGYAVLAAASGEQALDLLRRGARVDLLFTDVIMPGGMNGLQLVDETRRLRPRLPVLVTTGYMDELPGRGQGQRLNILAKPYKHGDLLERVEAALGKEM
jgi:CheY-like chemotaxis protein